MFDNAVMGEIAEAARQLNVETAALAAVAAVESGPKTHAMIDGRAEPLIRFEGHYFDRRLAGGARQEARRQGLAAPEAGKVRNPASQAARWKLLARASAIDAKAARESTSWGIGQVMGAHWAWLGYRNVDALVAEARGGLRGQLRLMARYIDKAGLAPALRRHDWAAFARGYNGPGFRGNDYDGKLARAYASHSARAAPVPNPAPTPALTLRRGARGEAVRTLQLALTARGHPLAVDGVFGPVTERAVRAFQTRGRLVVDGIAGPATMAALGLGATGAGRGGAGGGWLRALLAWLFVPRGA